MGRAVPVIVQTFPEEERMQEWLNDVREWVQALEPMGFAIALIVASVFTLVFLFLFRQGLRRHRIIADTPTVRLRSAAQGYAEIKGEVEAFDGEPLLSRLTRTPCCWYDYKIEREDRDSDGDKSWTTIDSGSSRRPLLVHDETHRALIDPEKADVVAREREQWHGTGGGGLSISLGPIQLNKGGRYRYTEHRIHEGDPLYVLGNLRSLDDDALAGHFLERGQTAAEAMVATARERTRSPDRLHLVEKPEDSRRPFLVSTHEEGQLIKRYRRQAMLFFVLLWLAFPATVLLVLGRWT